MISVIVPIYKVERYLEKCILSIQKNTYKDLEIICINDGSPDKCLQILEKLAAEDARIRVINQENQGVAAARNAGLEMARGEYIAFVDPDDWIHPQYFQSMLKCMEMKNADIAVSNSLRFADGEDVDVTRYNSIYYHKLTAERLFHGVYARHMAWGRLYRRKDIGEIRFTPEVRFSDDTLFNLRVIAGLERPIVYETDRQLYYFCQREGSIMHEADYEKMADLPEWVVNHREDVGEGPWSWMILMQAIKNELSCRYAAKLYSDQRLIKRSNRILKRFLLKMVFIRQIGTKEKLAHILMGCFPPLYRYYRIKDDPTLLEWERSIKEG